VLRRGFVEICVSDAGAGMAESLSPAYRRRFGVTPKEDIDPQHVMQFAFDEFGTRKTEADSWATDIHALARVLHLVERYGGRLRVGSSGVSIRYESVGAPFDRLPNHRGYRPTSVGTWHPKIRGTHIRLLLPLHPLKMAVDGVKRRPVLQRQLPETFFAQPEQVKGRLVALKHIFRSTPEAVDSVERQTFFDSCEKLARELIEGRSDPLVLDFSDLAWGEAQLETFLVKLQNVLQYRPVLLIELDPKLARGVVALERRSPTRAHDVAGLMDTPGQEMILETYARVAKPVLALDSNGRPFVFGLRDAECEAALERLIESPGTLSDVVSAGVSESKLLRILNSASSLFEPTDGGRWKCVWSVEDLAVEAARSIERHFDAVADSNLAWRGKELVRQLADGGQTEAVSPKYHLPWLNAWREDFLDMSRILARGRHADEIAQRLTFRLEEGLAALGRRLDDIEVLACTSAPALLLAYAIHRWWPRPNRPAVVDLGYYTLFNRVEDIPNVSTGGAALIVQDLIDSGESLEHLVATLRHQQTEVLAI
jgi:hypothetical protein